MFLSLKLTPWRDHPEFALGAIAINDSKVGWNQSSFLEIHNLLNVQKGVEGALWLLYGRLVVSALFSPVCYSP